MVCGALKIISTLSLVNLGKSAEYKGENVNGIKLSDLPHKVNLGQIFQCTRRDSSESYLFLRSSQSLIGRAETFLKNEHGNPFVTYSDKSSSLNKSNDWLIKAINKNLPVELPAVAIEALYMLVRKYETTCA